jgi:hypothetical protein
MRGDAEAAVSMALPKDAQHTIFCYPDIESRDMIMCVDVEVHCANATEFTSILRLNSAYLASKVTFEKEIYRAIVCAYRQHVDYTLKLPA